LLLAGPIAYNSALRIDRSKLIAPIPGDHCHMYRITQEIEFCYGHRLLNYKGKCRFLHGHNARVIIALAGEELDHRGMLVDFSDIKHSIRTWIDNELDHRMILNREDPIVPYLLEQQEPICVIGANPTAENIAKLVFDYTQQEGFPVVEVSLWETPRSCATYCPNAQGTVRAAMPNP
jgi:6-pyruvoyltetrahydropterin/6-carboxytetrahydropterin synthase